MQELYKSAPGSSTENPTGKTGKSPTTDPGPRPAVDDMARWLAVQHPADHAIESRAPDTKVPGSNKCKTDVQRFAPGAFREAAADARKRSGTAPAIYVVLNGIDTALPRKGRIVGGAKAGDVPRRYRLLIDCDPTREGTVSATDEEKAEALKVMEAIRAYLRARGWPEPLTADSGNGYHLVYAIDLPNDNDSTALVKAILAALAAKFDTAAVKVDQVVFDPPRLVKFYGTLSAKGPSTPERPHRYSRVLTAPATLEPVPTELLRALAAEAPPKPFDMDAEIQRKRDQAEADPAPKTILSIDEHLSRTAKKAPAGARGESPSVIDDFNRKAKWPDLLPDGWKHDHNQGDTEYWTRPGKDGGTSATIHRNDADRLYVFTTNASPFEPNKPYSKFDAYLLRNPGLTIKEAVKALAAEGYGTPRTKAKPRAVSDGPTGDARAGPEPSANGEAHTNGSPHAPPDPTAEDDQLDDLAIEDRFPTIDPLAFHGIAGEIVRAIDPHTEADPAATLIQFLVAFANLIGRSAFYRVGPTIHHLSLFCLMVGQTALGRKGTSWDGSKWVLELCDHFWADDRIQSGLVSGEGLIHHVRDKVVERRTIKGKTEEIVTDEGVSDKRLLIIETEFSRALKAMNKDGNTLSDVIRQAWDSGNLRTLGKIRPSKATSAHISIIGHTTEADVRKHLTDTDSANGFANRFLWACVRRSKELPEGGDFQSINWTPFQHHLLDVVKHARQCGEMKRGPDAVETWKGVYSELTSGKPGLLGSVTSRGGPQVLRLACVYALLDGRRVIDDEHLNAALALWDYCEASARYIFGDSHGDPAADKLLAALRAAPEGLSRKQINHDVFGRNKKAADLARLLSGLLTQGLIHRKLDRSTGGRPAEQWFAGRGDRVRS